MSEKPRVSILYTGVWIKGLLLWQRTFRHCQKVGNSHFRLKANVCAKSHSNPWKHSETITMNVRKKNLGLTFCTRMHGQSDRYHGNALSATVKRYVAHIFTSRPTCVPTAKSHWNPCKDIQTITRNIRNNLGLTFGRTDGRTHERSPFHSPLWRGQKCTKEDFVV